MAVAHCGQTNDFTLTDAGFPELLATLSVPVNDCPSALPPPAANVPATLTVIPNSEPGYPVIGDSTVLLSWDTGSDPEANVAQWLGPQSSTAVGPAAPSKVGQTSTNVKCGIPNIFILISTAGETLASATAPLTSCSSAGAADAAMATLTASPNPAQANPGGGDSSVLFSWDTGSDLEVNVAQWVSQNRSMAFGLTAPSKVGQASTDVKCGIPNVFVLIGPDYEVPASVTVPVLGCPRLPALTASQSHVQLSPGSSGSTVLLSWNTGDDHLTGKVFSVASNGLMATGGREGQVPAAVACGPNEFSLETGPAGLSTFTTVSVTVDC
jgi:hypothetical protein